MDDIERRFQRGLRAGTATGRSAPELPVLAAASQGERPRRGKRW